MPRPNEGNARAEGYTAPSGVRMRGPKASALGPATAAANRRSKDRGAQTMSGLATTTNSAVEACTPRLAARP